MALAVQKAPRITQQEAVRIADDLYGFDVSAASLPSERDQNFLLAQSSGEQFVLKIANAEEAFAFLELQNQLIRFLSSSKIELEFPRIVPTKKGEDIGTIRNENGREHSVRLLSVIDGDCFAK